MFISSKKNFRTGPLENAIVIFLPHFRWDLGQFEMFSWKIGERNLQGWNLCCLILLSLPLTSAFYLRGAVSQPWCTTAPPPRNLFFCKKGKNCTNFGRLSMCRGCFHFNKTSIKEESAPGDPWQLLNHSGLIKKIKLPSLTFKMLLRKVWSWGCLMAKLS